MNAQKELVGVIQDMTFAAFDFSAGIVFAVARADGVPALGTLAVEDGGAGRSVFLAPPANHSPGLPAAVLPAGGEGIPEGSSPH